MNKRLKCKRKRWFEEFIERFDKCTYSLAKLCKYGKHNKDSSRWEHPVEFASFVTSFMQTKRQKFSL